jgi:aminoglycoside phosphotransferase (APT) family kinase protein
MVSLPATRSDVQDRLTQALRRRFGSGVAVRSLSQATLGGSNRTFIFDLVDGDLSQRLVSREETFTDAVNPFLPPATQFRILTLVHRAGIPVAEPLFAYDEEDALGPGFVMRFAAGETLPRRILVEREAHPKLLRQLADVLARLHQLDVGQFGFLDTLPESGDPITAMRTRLDDLKEPHAALEYGLRWLEQNRPPARDRVLVHGDFRMGNFMVGEAGLAALLDWECTHLGDAAADLGWLCTRSWRFGRYNHPAGGLGSRRDLLEAYAAGGGEALNEDDIRWWERYGLVRWAMYNILQAHGFARGRRSPAFAACGRNTAMIEYDLLMTLRGSYD